MLGSHLFGALCFININSSYYKAYVGGEYDGLDLKVHRTIFNSSLDYTYTTFNVNRSVCESDGTWQLHSCAKRLKPYTMLTQINNRHTQIELRIRAQVGLQRPTNELTKTGFLINLHESNIKHELIYHCNLYICRVLNN